MVFNSRIRAMMLAVVIIILGIIHFGVGVGIVAKYHQFNDVFQQQVGLSGYIIFIGIVTTIIGIVGLIATVAEYKVLGKITACISIVVGILALASLITALVLSGQAASYFRDTITDYMNGYVQKDDAIVVMDNLQTTYQCCGVNLWLDWSRVQLGSTSQTFVGRRRRQQYQEETTTTTAATPLLQAVRKKRQMVVPGSPIYNLPSSYTINLPLSCCKAGGTTNGNSLGGYCVFNAYNGSSSFYVGGCLEPVANVGFSQITGIAVINTALTILAFVYFAKLYNFCCGMDDTGNKQSNQNGISPFAPPPPYEQQQQQAFQYPYEPYYMNSNIPPSVTYSYS